MWTMFDKSSKRTVLGHLLVYVDDGIFSTNSPIVNDAINNIAKSMDAVKQEINSISNT